MRVGVLALAALLTLGAATEFAEAQAAKPAQEPKPAQIDRNGVLILIRTSLLALDEANKTGNYTVLRDMGAPGFQSANTAARLGDIFASLRNDKVDLSGVAVLEPQLTLLPQIEGNGLMHMAGFFPSVPRTGEVRTSLCSGRWPVEAVRHARQPCAERPGRASEGSRHGPPRPRPRPPSRTLRLRSRRSPRSDDCRPGR